MSFSSSKATVKMAPGGVQVPIMRWWTGIFAVVEKSLVSELLAWKAERRRDDRESMDWRGGRKMKPARGEKFRDVRRI